MSASILFSYFKTPLGELILGSFEDKLCLCDWRYRKMRDSINARIKKELKAELQEGTSKVIENTMEQLTEYFEKKTFIEYLFSDDVLENKLGIELKTYRGEKFKRFDEKNIDKIKPFNNL